MGNSLILLETIAIIKLQFVPLSKATSILAHYEMLTFNGEWW